MTAGAIPLGKARAISRFAPGLSLCLGVTVLAYIGEWIERMLFDRAWLEALVLAILIGAFVRSVWKPGARYCAGIGFGAKFLLEVAVVLLGASISASTILAAGPGLVVAVAGTVAVAIACSFVIGRSLGLPARLSLLVACGNSICGNSAIAAVAPVIGADGDDVAASIGFTAVFGVIVVLGLPLLNIAVGMNALQYGVLAGLTVYAVPQVIAAAAPIGPVAVQMGTLVKLVRVLMLGPVCVLLSLVAPRLSPDHVSPELPPRKERPRSDPLPAVGLIPWFIIGFLLMLMLRSLDLLPHRLLPPASAAATILTVISMAGLGLGVDVRTVASSGVRVTAAVTLSLLALGGISLVLIRGLHII